MHEKRLRLLQLGAALTQPHIWGDAIETQWARIEEARGPLGLLPPVRETSLDELETAARITWEAHFLVIAIRQLLRTQEAYFQHTHDERLTEARAPFDRAVPHAVVFRNVLEHLDDYLLDRGTLQDKGVVPTGLELVVRHERRSGRVTLDFGDLQFDLGEAAAAAPALVEVTAMRLATGNATACLLAPPHTLNRAPRNSAPRRSRLPALAGCVAAAPHVGSPY